MSITGFNSEKCAQRNRVAATRYGVNSVPVHFFKGGAAPVASVPAVWSRGTLPKDTSEALTRINSRLPDGSTPLTADDVHIHYLEAANGNYIGDRYMFLSVSTLKNIAANAEKGFAFMNSHRTGGLSHPSELPFGRTFAGRYEQVTGEDGTQTRRAVVGVYMLRGKRPNGSSGPSTDDLHDGIEGGTIFDVSVGLRAGEMNCDICGNGVNAINESTGDYLCPHIPGTTYALSADDQQRQFERGVDGGVATATLFDAYCGEVSAVYDGAVPGAGFQKALALSQRGVLPKQDVKQICSAYSALLGKGELDGMSIDISEIEENAEPVVKRILHRLGFGAGNAPQQLQQSQQFAQIEQHPLLTHVLSAGVNTLGQFDALQSKASERDAFAHQNAEISKERDDLAAKVASMEPKAKAYDDKFATMRDDADKCLVALYTQDADLSFHRTILAGIPDGANLERHASDLDKQFSKAFPQQRASAPNSTAEAPKVTPRFAADSNGAAPEVKAKTPEEKRKEAENLAAEY